MSKLYPKCLGIFVSVLFLSQTLSAQDKNLEQYRPILLKNAAQLGLTKAEIETADIASGYTDEKTKMTYLYLQQVYQHINVYTYIKPVALMNNAVQYSSGDFIKNIETKAGSATPAISYTDAIKAALRHIQMNDAVSFKLLEDKFSINKSYKVSAVEVADSPIEVTLYWTASDDRTRVTLTWNVNIDVKGKDDWWNIRINAQTGEFVQKDNQTVYETPPTQPIISMPPAQEEQQLNSSTTTNDQSTTISLNNTNTSATRLAPPNVTSATYRVIRYPFENPAQTGFTNEVSPWMMAGATNAATTLGWHFDGTTNYDITRGNNVFAHLDFANTNTPDAINNWPDTSSTTAPNLTFVNPASASQAPDSSRPHKKAALDNLFYWNNVIHDIMYQYGLTEVAGNFQASNQGRGGLENDAVQAHAQDASGSNNANFATPNDGASGRMQMFLFDGTPTFTINSPAAITGNYPSAESSLTTSNKLRNKGGTITGEVVLYVDASGTTNTGCTAASNAAQISGKIALINGTVISGCSTWGQKVKGAQNAGAIAVIVYLSSNAVGSIGDGLNDQTITVPTISVALSTGNSIRAQLANGPVTATIAGAIGFDGSLDNGIVVHEYGHGISNRLTGGPSFSGCLGNAEQAGEGWSDYYALMMTTDWANTAINAGATPRTVGAYGLGNASGAGFRRYPYTTNMAVNPLTYSYVNNASVHNNGEVWCSALWDMTWNIIAQENAITADLYNSAGTGGNIISMNLVTTGLKLQACSPGFLDGRNAILAADSILYGYRHKCAIWAAFARRGMGVSASQGSNTSATDQVQAFDLPTSAKLTKSSSLLVNTNTQVDITSRVTCDCSAGTFTVRDTIPAGFTYVSSTPSGTLNGNVLTFPATAFASSETKDFVIRLMTPATGCAIDTVINDNRDANTTGGFTSSGTYNWTPTATRSFSGSSWFASNLATASSTFLTSGATAQAASKPLSILSFRHLYETEAGFDGGVIEYSTDAGGTWLDASPFILTGGYNTTMSTSSTLPGRRAYSGRTNGGGFAPVLLSVGSFGNTPVQFRFRMESDDLISVIGWYVDNILRVNGCGEILRSGVYNSSDVLLQTDVIPMFVGSNIALPLTLVSFNAVKAGNDVSVYWNTREETNVKDFDVEWSIDGINWTKIATKEALNRSNSNYSFLHTSPINGRNFYRLKMNDIDTRYTYSTVRIVNFDDKSTTPVTLIPNPVKDNAVLYIDKGFRATQVSIYNAAGALVKQIKVGAGVRQLDISTNSFANGVYTIITSGETNITTKMVVTH